MKKHFVKAEIKRSDKGMLAIASTSVEDRQGEVIDQSGWNLKNFKKNPVLLWAHDHYEPAIGTAKNIKIVGEGKKSQLVFEPVFHDKTPFAKAIKTLYEGTDDLAPVLNSFSVGFQAVEMDGNTFTDQELLEISAVNVPANPEARILATKALKQAGLATDSVVEKLEIATTAEGEDEEEDEDKDKDKAINDLTLQVKQLEQQYQEVVNGLKHLNPQGRKSEVVTQRLALNKVIARSADKILESQPKGNQAKLLKVIKRASEQLIVDHKQELKSGKN